MKAAIIGTGWVTPLGRDVKQVWQAVKRGEKAKTSTLTEADQWPIWSVPLASVAAEQALPRLRRSSVISHFAVAAAKDAVAMAGLSAEELSRCALIFAASDGGVIYTRRFYADIVKNGPASGSPLLFPETVYNAPASHVAAVLGIEGEVLTLVGDAAAGLSAIHTARELLADNSLKHCLVVAAQELDWISTEAYGQWNLIKGVKNQACAPFAEGAAALVLGRKPEASQVTFSHPGFSYFTGQEARERLRSLLTTIPVELQPTVIIASDSGGDFYRIEQEVFADLYPGSMIIRPKLSLGEALGVSTLQQMIIANQLLQETPVAKILIPSVGFNGQLGAAILTGHGSRSQD